MTAITTVSTSFSSVTSGGSLFVRRGRKAYYTVSGTFVQTLQLQRMVSGDAWEAVAQFTGTVGLAQIGPKETDETYRLACVARTSGTAVTTLYDEAATQFEVKDQTGKVVLSVDELGVLALQAQPTNTATSEPVVVAGIGAAAGTGVAATEYGGGIVHRTVLTFTNVDVALADEAGVVAYGSLKVYDFPEGAIQLLGAVSDIDLTKSSAGVNDDWDGDVGVGTTAADNDATLATTEQDIIPTTATPQAVDGATTANAQSSITQAGLVLDGTATAADVYVNLLVDDADQDVTGTACNLIMNGTLTLTWINLGDY